MDTEEGFRMPDRVVRADVPWETYVRVHDDGTAHGNIYIKDMLVYQCEISSDDWDASPGGYTDEEALNATWHQFGFTLWKVLFEAHDPKERGQ